MHEKNLNKKWGIPLLPIIRIPLIHSQGKKISASEEDGIVGLFPTNRNDIENMIKAFIKPEYLGYFLLKFDHQWFACLLKKDDPILDAPIWSYGEL